MKYDTLHSWGSEDSPWESLLSYHVGRELSLSLGGKHLYLLGPHNSPTVQVQVLMM